MILTIYIKFDEHTNCRVEISWTLSGDGGLV